MIRTETALLLLLSLLLAGCGAGPKKVYSRAQFEKEFMGATPAAVRARLGRPDEVTDTGAYAGVCWTYKYRTRDQGGEIDNRVVLCFNRHDRVYSINQAKY